MSNIEKDSYMDYINIVIAPDNNYSMQCAVLMKSIISNCDKNVYFHILQTDITKKNQAKIESILHNSNHKLHFYNMSEFDFSHLPLNRNYISEATYYRLKIVDILPSAIKKIIYLDCDMIVTKNIQELYDINLDDKIAGVVEDEVSITNMQRLDLPIKNNYFNAGMLLLDIEKLRNFDFEKKCINYYNANKYIITCQDQDILNGVLNGFCKYIPIYWNTDGRVYSLNNTENTKTKAEMLNAIKFPGIIHYTYIYKPWLSNCKHSARYLWWKYLIKTPYKFYVLEYVRQLFFKILYSIFVINLYNDGRYKVLKISLIKIKWNRNKYYRNIEQILSQLKKYKQQDYDTLYVPVSGIGDGVLFSAVAKMIYEKTAKKVLVSHKNNELFNNNPYIETIDGIHDTLINKTNEKKIKKLGFNIVYPTYWNFPEQRGRLQLAYPKQHIITAVAEKTGFIGHLDLKPEIFLTDEEKKFGRFTENKKQIVIMSTAFDLHKQWDKWQELVNELKDIYYFIQLGAADDVKLEGVVDKRGEYTLRECASILYNSDLFVGQIGGLMHIARAVDCPAVIAYSGAEPIYFDSYICNTNVLPQKMCDICTQDGTSAYSQQCNNDYCCIKSIEVCDMVNAIKSKLANPKQTLEFETININNSNNVHLVDYYKRYSPKLCIFKNVNKKLKFL